ncbi:hypothetical protein I3842_08G117700 [Carya illinoinensis]|uniref:Protein FAR1-RELATED SEQUENCE n=1 Tax=Carya illinoinensis TaxID=32201 RepID=A0A922EEG2_CARIL|nr:hypothetical protein I3842_08G117700 [Carya illinoinensis]
MVEEVPVEEVPSRSHGNDDDSVIEPKPWMSFKTEHEIIDYYKQYGKQTGFGVMTQRSKMEDDGSVRYLTLGCARGGKARNRNSNVSKPRPTMKMDCKAKVNAILFDGVLHITIIENAHNHGLSPRKARFFRCNRAINDSVKRQLDINDKAGISMAKSFNPLVVEAGGYDNLPFVEKDARNYIDKARYLRLGKGDAYALCGYFERMQYKNYGLKNVFWVDARSRVAYGYFGDIVTFDTTYLTNRYGMSFAHSIGVNHHGQSILFGAGLISSEDIDTFVWLFETWLKCIDGKAPNAIITDQDRAMKNAIAIRMYWVSMYLKNTFWTGMSTTQRSESINTFFDGLVRTTLKEFVDQFDNALRKGGEAEMAADFHSFNCNIPCITHLPVEKQFQDLYTKSKFKEVQSKVMGVIYAHCILIKTEGAISTYEVNDQLQVEGSIKRVTYMSYFNEEECEAKCMCGLFHMRGIFCRHILVIFSVKDVHSVPSKYIMDRWRKDIKHRYALIRSNYDNLSGKPSTTRYANLVKLCLKVATNACEDDDNSVDMTQKLKTMNSIYTKNNEQPIFTNTSTEVGDIEMGSSKKVLSPRIVRGKGRPSSMRREPAI